MSSSNVSTKSTSLRIVRLEASSFFAAHGPINAIQASGSSFLSILAVSTIGVKAIEMYGARVGKSFFAITDHAGQHDVAMNG